jgi:DAACS family dicarboxylate/amino acid:cation (Na+ or H+) symporter
LYIQVIKGIAVPLVFISIIEALLTTQLSLKMASRWLGVVAINAFCALTLGLAISNILRPGDGFVFGQVRANSDVGSLSKDFSLQTFLASLVPSSIVAPFVDNNVIGVALLALLIGVALRAHCASSSAEVSLNDAARVSRIFNAVINQILLWLVALVPVAIFCVTAKTVGVSGFAPFKGLLKYLGAAILGLTLQITVVYPWWIKRVGGIPIKRFLSAALKPATYAFGTNSSLATVPVTLHALDQLGVPKSASRLATCIGTNLNNDGILLYEAMAALFVAQALGIDLSLGEQIFAAVISLVAAVGVAGVPEAGVVSLSLVLTAVGLPLDILPLLLTVDWIVARMRSVTNVLSDMAVSVAVGAKEGANP